MKAIVTGASGTLGKVLVNTLAQQGYEAIPWDRSRVPIDDYTSMMAFVSGHRPDVLFHLAIASQSTGRDNEQWLVNYEWPSELAWICKELGIRLVYTSTAMVFSDHNKGPHTLDSVPDAAEGYGYVKRMSEERVFYQNPDAIIARLGWQIGKAPGSNNMIDFFDKNMKEQGQVSCSTRWLPACSFLEDTALALLSLVNKEKGLYMIDANDHWNFFEIASALNALHGDIWNIVPNEDFIYDQRMIDDRVNIPLISTHLPHLIK